MTGRTLPDFPVDEETLALLDRALDPTATGVSSVGALLDLLSGYDPAKVRAMFDDDGCEVPGIVEYPDAVYHTHDVLRALMAEVRRLRGRLT